MAANCQRTELLPVQLPQTERASPHFRLSVNSHGEALQAFRQQSRGSLETLPQQSQEVTSDFSPTVTGNELVTRFERPEK